MSNMSMLALRVEQLKELFNIPLPVSLSPRYCLHPPARRSTIDSSTVTIFLNEDSPIFCPFYIVRPLNAHVQLANGERALRRRELLEPKAVGESGL